MSGLFVSTTFLPDGRTAREALDLCALMDIDGVELGSNHRYEENYDYLGAYDLVYLLHNYFPIPEKGFVVNIASRNEEIRQASIAHIEKAIDFGVSCGGRLYTFHPGFVTDPLGASLDASDYDFRFDDAGFEPDGRQEAIDTMYRSLDDIVAYAARRQMNIAIESEGSVSQRHHLLMQEPEEYQDFMQRYDSRDIGINLNIGHLHLASKAFSFAPWLFVDTVSGYVRAMELSHNDGHSDEHLPLQDDGWYWPLILDRRFESVPKILEYRNTTAEKMKESVAMFHGKNHAI